MADSEVIYLDTNAISYLWTSKEHSATDLESVRKKLRYDASNGWKRFLISVAMLEEVCRLYGRDPRTLRPGEKPNPARNPAIYSHVLNEALFLAQGNIVRSIAEFVKVEARKKRRLYWDELFLEDLRRDELIDKLQDRKFLFYADQRLHEEDRAFSKTEKEAVVYFKELLADKRHDMTAEWFSRAEAIIDDWARDFMAEKRREWRLPVDKRMHLSPKKLPALWNLTSYHVARIYWIHGLGRRLDSSDMRDSAHFGHAAYADTFVTGDEGLISKSNLAGVGTLRIVRFREWVAEILTGS